MKKSFLTKEYSLEAQPGTMSMRESRNYFSSKILEIEDVLVVGSDNISWFENADHTQGIGLDNQLLSLDMATLKTNNHAVGLNPLQSDAEKKDFTKWVFTFDVKQMVREYVFAKLKEHGTFATIANKDTFTNDVSAAIYDYVDANVLPRIRFESVNLYVRYVPLSNLPGVGGLALQYDTRFDFNLLNIAALSGESNAAYQQRKQAYKVGAQVKNFQLTTDLYGDVATANYKQVESSQAFKFDYYFDIVYVKA